MSMKNETAIITGSTSGIGKELAKVFLSQGCKVAVCSRSAERVNSTMAELKEKFGDNVIGFPCDVSDSASVQSLVKKVMEKFGSIRILVANAGINLKYGPFRCMTGEEVQQDAIKVIGVNLIGMMNSVSAVLPQMYEQKYGRIITLTGGGAERPLAHMTAYSASKGGVEAFSKCLNEELQEDDIDIKLNIYQPGMLKTGLTSQVKIVSGWRNEEEVLKDAALAIEYMGSDIHESTLKVIPYVLPSCKKSGAVFRGFSLFKMVRGAIKLQKLLKQKES